MSGQWQGDQPVPDDDPAMRNPALLALIAILGFEAFVIIVYAYLARIDRARGHLAIGRPRQRKPTPPP